MSEFIAEAQVLITPNLAAFTATLRKQLEVAVAAAGPVVIPVTAAPVAAAEIAGAQKAIAAETTAATSAIQHQTGAAVRQAAALEGAGAAASVAAAEQRRLAAAEVAAARAHAQVARGVAAETLALTGLRGATLAASAPFLVGATAAIVAVKSIKAASDQTEQLNKSIEVFTTSADDVKKWAESTATSIGISETAALAAASTYGQLFRTLGVGVKPAAELSQALVELASDLASFNNVSPERALAALQSGLVGQARPLRQLGIFLTAARVQEEALTETGKKLATQLTQQDKILARETLIFKDSAIAQGDFERTQGRLANQGRILSAQLDDIAAGIGTKLLPALTDVAIATNAALTGLQKLAKANPIPGGPDVTNLLGWVGGWKELGFVWDHSIFPGLFKMENEMGALDRVMLGAAKAALNLAGALAKVGDATKVPSEAAKSDLAISLAQSSGNQSQELALLQQRQARQQDFLDRLLAEPIQSAKQVALEKKASDNLAQTNAQIQRILDQRASAAEKAAQDQQNAREDAANAQAKATQAFIDTFTGRSSKLQEALSRAASNDNFKQQIAINKVIIANDLKEITAIRDRIRHLHLHGEALKAAAAAIQAAQKEIQDARDAITDAQKARKAAIEDIINQKLDLRIQIAQARDDVAAEIKARTVRLELLTKQLAKLKNAGKKNTIAWLQLKLQQIEEIKAINELQTKTKEKANTQSQFFNFLQAQSGFAANLLGNLIPGFATAGLVGNAAQASGDSGLRQVPGGFEQPRGAVQSQASIATVRDRGVRPVQVDTTNQILRQILRTLQGRSNPPEITHNRQRANAAYDTLGAMGD